MDFNIEEYEREYVNDWARNHREAARKNEQRYRENNREKRNKYNRKYVISDEKKEEYKITNRLRYHLNK